MADVDGVVQRTTGSYGLLALSVPQRRVRLRWPEVVRPHRRLVIGRALHGHTIHTRTTKLRSDKKRSIKASVPEVSAVQTGTGEEAREEVRSGQIHLPQIGLGEIRPIQVRADEALPAQVHRPQTAPTKISTIQVGKPRHLCTNPPVSLPPDNDHPRRMPYAAVSVERPIGSSVWLGFTVLGRRIRTLAPAGPASASWLRGRSPVESGWLVKAEEVGLTEAT
jgi:hypothetical protein